MTYATMRIERGGSVAHVVLARPQVRNAFDAAMIAELTDAVQTLAADVSLRAVVFRGDGSSFCAGADMEWMRGAAARGPAANLEDARRTAGLFRAIDAMPCSTLALAHGAALGGGTGLAAAVDICVAEAGCKFGFTEVRLGIIPAVISAFALRAIGVRQARRWFVTGEIFDAARAANLGLVHEVVPAGEGRAAIDRLVAGLLTVGPLAARAAKRLIADVSARPFPAVLEFAAQTLADLRATPEAREGLSAFLEKRPATFVERTGDPT